MPQINVRRISFGSVQAEMQEFTSTSGWEIYRDNFVGQREFQLKRLTRVKRLLIPNLIMR